MLLVGLSEPDLANEIRVFVKGEHFYATTPERLISTPGGTAVILGAKLGGNRVRAVELIPVLVKAAPKRPVVLLTPTPSASERREAIDLGAYAVVDVADPTYPERLLSILGVASKRRRARVASARRSLH